MTFSMTRARWCSSSSVISMAIGLRFAQDRRSVKSGLRNSPSYRPRRNVHLLPTASAARRPIAVSHISHSIETARPRLTPLPASLRRMMGPGFFFFSDVRKPSHVALLIGRLRSVNGSRGAPATLACGHPVPRSDPDHRLFVIRH